MATLPPTPSYNANIPIVTSAGGTTAAYKDPNSPESIMKKTTEIKAQSTVDSKYDVAQSPYAQGFKNYRRSTMGGAKGTLLTFVILLFIILVVFKTLKFVAKIFIASLAVILLLILIVYFTR